MRRFWIWNCWFLFLWQGLPLKISWMTGWQDHKQQFQQQQVQELLEQKVHQLQLQVQQQQQQQQKAQQQQAQQQAQQEAEQQCPVRKCSELCHVIVGVVAVFFWSGLVCGWKILQVSATSKDAGRAEEGVSLTRSCNFVQFYPLPGQMVRSSPQMMVWFDTKTVQATIDRGAFLFWLRPPLGSSAPRLRNYAKARSA